ncbi:extracellular triacylglycerol lipase precursor [Mycena metata]|uniref:Carboxylic ester hydrolase n=1 Tax=Mycena metata TaxID=1033252 RepID=A0AAD7MQU4_9AGAR|nr:extracellular triacylglycerol lipase precursor [Mycena metata]
MLVTPAPFLSDIGHGPDGSGHDIQFALLILSHFSTFLRACGKAVQLGNTTLTGAKFDNVEFYGGIPYAEAPVGSLRFRNPVLLSKLNSTTLNASQFGPGCLQPPVGSEETKTSEDCLSINIFRPANLASSEALPVMAFIHGGGFIFGSSADYNASSLVKQSISRGTPVIYVSFNYRLGPLGFAQGREAAESNALNRGLRDQLTALQWIQDHVASFGGSKSKVTLFGESAGSAAVSTLFLNPNLAKLVWAGIFESGGAGGLSFLFGPLTRQLDWDNFVNAIPECANSTGSSLECLQRLDNSTTLQQAIITSWAESKEGYPWVPVLDDPNGLLPDLPSVLLERGKFARLPFIAGSNLDEGTYFVNPLVNFTAELKSRLLANYSSSTVPDTALEAAIDRLLELYPDIPALGSSYNTGNQTFGFNSQFKRLSSIMGDLMITSQRREWNQAASKFGVKTFGYLFTDAGAPPIAPPTVGPISPAAALGVPHTAELVYIYNLTAAFQRPASAMGLSIQMVDYWISFATSLDPNDGLGSVRPAWSQHTDGNKMVLELNSANLSMIPDNYREQQTDFITSNAVIFPQ